MIITSFRQDGSIVLTEECHGTLRAIPSNEFGDSEFVYAILITADLTTQMPVQLGGRLEVSAEDCQ